MSRVRSGRRRPPLHLDLRRQTLRVTKDRRHRRNAPALQERHGAVARARVAIHLDAVPPLGVHCAALEGANQGVEEVVQIGLQLFPMTRDPQATARKPEEG